jgi:hypothetical protein
MSAREMALPTAPRAFRILLHIAQQDIGCGFTPVEACSFGVEQACIGQEMALII